MPDRPILFSAPMIRALLAGRKTQTRRELSAVKGLPFDHDNYEWSDDLGIGFKKGRLKREFVSEPRVQAGDRLWVREAWRFINAQNEPGRGPEICIGYEADGDKLPNRPILKVRQAVYEKSDAWWHQRKRPSMFMPRWASRITLVVTDVRVQRLQEISEADAIAEGISPLPSGRYFCGHDDEGEITAKSPITAYGWLWNHINGPDAWAANPWVVAYSFTVALRNIDQVAA